MNFKDYITQLSEETTSGDIAQVQSKLGGPAAQVQKRPKTTKVRKEDEEVDVKEEDHEDYENLKPDNIKSAAVVAQQEENDEESEENKKEAKKLPKK